MNKSEIELVSLSHELMSFRQQLERDAGAPIDSIELNVALLLLDLCEFLKLGIAQRRAILGNHTFDHLTAVINSNVTLPTKH